MERVHQRRDDATGASSVLEEEEVWVMAATIYGTVEFRISSVP
jgi:hypothetical protein